MYMTVIVFLFNDTATTEIYTLSLHDALPISPRLRRTARRPPSASWCSATARWTRPSPVARCASASRVAGRRSRSEEHTSELQSRSDLVCRLLLEKKKLIHLYFHRYLHTIQHS